jgi:GNAT superfamily N-acetyltransferase
MVVQQMMKIITVKSKSELLEFIKVPWNIYKNDPNWVPQLIFDTKFILTENPFWEHAEKELYILKNDKGRTIGRIAAIIDRNYIEFQNEQAGFFGFFECINDINASKILFDKASNYLKSKNMNVMRGPMNPSTNDECGFLFEGYNSPPRLMMPYNPPYYHELSLANGLSKAKDLYAYDMDVTTGPVERLKKLTSLVNKRVPGLTVRKFNLKDFKNEIKKAISVYNSAWEKNWAFVPWTEKEFYTIASRMKELLLVDTTLLAEIDGKPVGMLIAVPDYNFVMKKMNGRMLPFGFLKFLYYKHKIDALRLMIMGVKREYRQKGIEGVMYHEGLKNALALGFKKSEFSWILDDNTMTQRAAEMMGGKLYKKYRIYELKLK